MKEKSETLKSKIDELKELLNKNTSSYKEITESITLAHQNKDKITENIIKIQGILEGLQYSLQLEKLPVTDSMAVEEITDVEPL